MKIINTGGTIGPIHVSEPVSYIISPKYIPNHEIQIGQGGKVTDNVIKLPLTISMTFEFESNRVWVIQKIEQAIFISKGFLPIRFREITKTIFPVDQNPGIYSGTGSKINEYINSENKSKIDSNLTDFDIDKFIGMFTKNTEDGGISVEDYSDMFFDHFTPWFSVVKSSVSILANNVTQYNIILSPLDLDSYVSNGIVYYIKSDKGVLLHEFITRYLNFNDGLLLNSDMNNYIQSLNSIFNIAEGSDSGESKNGPEKMAINNERYEVYDKKDLSLTLDYVSDIYEINKTKKITLLSPNYEEYYADNPISNTFSGRHAKLDDIKGKKYKLDNGLNYVTIKSLKEYVDILNSGIGSGSQTSTILSNETNPNSIDYRYGVSAGYYFEKIDPATITVTDGDSFTHNTLEYRVPQVDTFEVPKTAWPYADPLEFSINVEQVESQIKFNILETDFHNLDLESIYKLIDPVQTSHILDLNKIISEDSTHNEALQYITMALYGHAVFSHYISDINHDYYILKMNQEAISFKRSYATIIRKDKNGLTSLQNELISYAACKCYETFKVIKSSDNKPLSIITKTLTAVINEYKKNDKFKGIFADSDSSSILGVILNCFNDTTGGEHKFSSRIDNIRNGNIIDEFPKRNFHYTSENSSYLIYKKTESETKAYIVMKLNPDAVYELKRYQFSLKDNSLGFIAHLGSKRIWRPGITRETEFSEYLNSLYFDYPGATNLGGGYIFLDGIFDITEINDVIDELKNELTIYPELSIPYRKLINSVNESFYENFEYFRNTGTNKDEAYPVLKRGIDSFVPINPNDDGSVTISYNTFNVFNETFAGSIAITISDMFLNNYTDFKPPYLSPLYLSDIANGFVGDTGTVHGKTLSYTLADILISCIRWDQLKIKKNIAPYRLYSSSNDLIDMFFTIFKKSNPEFLVDNTHRVYAEEIKKIIPKRKAVTVINNKKEFITYKEMLTNLNTVSQEILLIAKESIYKYYGFIDGVSVMKMPVEDVEILNSIVKAIEDLRSLNLDNKPSLDLSMVLVSKVGDNETTAGLTECEDENLIKLYNASSQSISVSEYVRNVNEIINTTLAYGTKNFLTKKIIIRNSSSTTITSLFKEYLSNNVPVRAGVYNQGSYYQSMGSAQTAFVLQIRTTDSMLINQLSNIYYTSDYISKQVINLEKSRNGVIKEALSPGYLYKNKIKSIFGLRKTYIPSVEDAFNYVLKIESNQFNRYGTRYGNMDHINIEPTLNRINEFNVTIQFSKASSPIQRNNGAKQFNTAPQQEILAESLIQRGYAYSHPEKNIFDPKKLEQINFYQDKKTIKLIDTYSLYIYSSSMYMVSSLYFIAAFFETLIKNRKEFGYLLAEIGFFYFTQSECNKLEDIYEVGNKDRLNKLLALTYSLMNTSQYNTALLIDNILSVLVRTNDGTNVDSIYYSASSNDPFTDSLEKLVTEAMNESAIFYNEIEPLPSKTNNKFNTNISVKSMIIKELTDLNNSNKSGLNAYIAQAHLVLLLEVFSDKFIQCQHNLPAGLSNISIEKFNKQVEIKTAKNNGIKLSTSARLGIIDNVIESGSMMINGYFELINLKNTYRTLISDYANGDNKVDEEFSNTTYTKTINNIDTALRTYINIANNPSAGAPTTVKYKIAMTSSIIRRIFSIQSFLRAHGLTNTRQLLDETYASSISPLRHQLIELFQTLNIKVYWNDIIEDVIKNTKNKEISPIEEDELTDKLTFDKVFRFLRLCSILYSKISPSNNLSYDVLTPHNQLRTNEIALYQKDSTGQIVFPSITDIEFPVNYSIGKAGYHIALENILKDGERSEELEIKFIEDLKMVLSACNSSDGLYNKSFRSNPDNIEINVKKNTANKKIDKISDLLTNGSFSASSSIIAELSKFIFNTYVKPTIFTGKLTTDNLWFDHDVFVFSAAAMHFGTYGMNSPSSESYMDNGNLFDDGLPKVYIINKTILYNMMKKYTGTFSQAILKNMLYSLKFNNSPIFYTANIDMLNSFMAETSGVYDELSKIVSQQQLTSGKTMSQDIKTTLQNDLNRKLDKLKADINKLKHSLVRDFGFSLMTIDSINTDIRDIINTIENKSTYIVGSNINYGLSREWQNKLTKIEGIIPEDSRTRFLEIKNTSLKVSEEALLNDQSNSYAENLLGSVKKISLAISSGLANTTTLVSEQTEINILLNKIISNIEDMAIISYIIKDNESKDSTKRQILDILPESGDIKNNIHNILYGLNGYISTAYEDYSVSRINSYKTIENITKKGKSLNLLYPTIKILVYNDSISEMMIFENMFSFSNITNCMVASSKRNCSKVAEIELLDPYDGLFTVVDRLALTSEGKVNPFLRNASETDAINSYFLRPGTNIQIRMGHSSYLSDDDIVFNGRIVTIDNVDVESNKVRIKAANYGSNLNKLLHDKNANIIPESSLWGNDPSIKDGYNNDIILNYISKFAAMKQEAFYGLMDNNSVTGYLSSSPYDKNYSSSTFSVRYNKNMDISKTLTIHGLLPKRQLNMFENMNPYRPVMKTWAQTASRWLYLSNFLYQQGESVWKSMRQIMLHYPGNIMTVREYGNRETIVIGKRNDVYKTTDVFANSFYSIESITEKINSQNSSPYENIKAFVISINKKLEELLSITYSTGKEEILSKLLNKNSSNNRRTIEEDYVVKTIYKFLLALDSINQTGLNSYRSGDYSILGEYDSIELHSVETQELFAEDILSFYKNFFNEYGEYELTNNNEYNMGMYIKFLETVTKGISIITGKHRKISKLHLKDENNIIFNNLVMQDAPNNVTLSYFMNQDLAGTVSTIIQSGGEFFAKLLGSDATTATGVGNTVAGISRAIIRDEYNVESLVESRLWSVLEYPFSKWIRASERKSYIAIAPNTFLIKELGRDEGEYVATAVGENILSQYYGGQFIMIGDSNLKPYDRINLSDVTNDMYGVFEIDDVVHIYGAATGFITSVGPNMVVETMLANTETNWIGAGVDIFADFAITPILGALAGWRFSGKTMGINSLKPEFNSKQLWSARESTLALGRIAIDSDIYKKIGNAVKKTDVIPAKFQRQIVDKFSRQFVDTLQDTEITKGLKIIKDNLSPDEIVDAMKKLDLDVGEEITDAVTLLTKDNTDIAQLIDADMTKIRNFYNNHIKKYDIEGGYDQPKHGDFRNYVIDNINDFILIAKNKLEMININAGKSTDGLLGIKNKLDDFTSSLLEGDGIKKRIGRTIYNAGTSKFILATLVGGHVQMAVRATKNVMINQTIIPIAQGIGENMEVLILPIRKKNEIMLPNFEGYDKREADRNNPWNTYWRETAKNMIGETFIQDSFLQ